MSIFNPGPGLVSTLQAVLGQPECLELLVADCGSSDGTLEKLDELASVEPRLRILDCADEGPADSLNKAFRHVRGTLICWLNVDDFYVPGTLARAVAALESHPEWLMVYGDGEEFSDDTGYCLRYPTLPPYVGLEGFSSHCFIYQPTVVYRRSMGLLLGNLDSKWRIAFDFDYWVRAFSAFPHRIGYVPHLQVRTKLYDGAIIRQNRAHVSLSSTRLQACYSLPADSSISQYSSQKHLHRSWLGGESVPPSQIEDCRWQPVGVREPSESLPPFAQRPFGVNLIGHAFEVFGIGEDLRMAARALQAAGVPCCVIHHPASNGSFCSERILEPMLCTNPSSGPYAFNLVCMAAPTQARWLRQGGCEPLRERYTLSSWPWETQQWPGAWRPLLQLADEAWVATTFTAAALQSPTSEAGIPLQVMSMAAEIVQPDRFCSAVARTAIRARHCLPTGAVLFGYGFDFNSTAIRKNPMAALEAFQLAFPLPHLPATFGRDCDYHPLSDNVALIIKTFPPQAFSAEWNWLKARASEDSRIHLISKCLERDELLALYGACDVFLSLHRSEGFGRGIAEALQLGVDVIATDFGGNTDFCNGILSHPVCYSPAPIPPGAYPYAEGHSWAEPNLEHAAELCREVAARRLSIAEDPHAPDPSRDPDVLAAYRERFSFRAVGARYRARLEDLWADRDAIGQRLRWRGDRSPVG